MRVATDRLIDTTPVERKQIKTFIKKTGTPKSLALFEIAERQAARKRDRRSRRSPDRKFGKQRQNPFNRRRGSKRFGFR